MIVRNCLFPDRRVQRQGMPCLYVVPGADIAAAVPSKINIHAQFE
jgi:hypothetical protein